MSAFHETVKHFLGDVDKFLRVILKDENLSKPAKKEKTKVLDSLQKLYDEFESLNPYQDEGSSSSSRGLTDESRFTSSSAHSQGSHGSEEEGYSENIAPTSIAALGNPTKRGFLQKKPIDLLKMFTKGMKYCVVHKNVFYWFKKSGDKKQQGAVSLSGYEFKDLTHEKDFVFELSSTKKKCHQFQAETKDDFEEWRKAVETGIKHIQHKISVAEEDDIFEDGETYEDIHELANTMRRAPPSPTNKAAVAKREKPPLPAANQPSSPESTSPDDVYDEGCSMSTDRKTEPTKEKTTSLSDEKFEQIDDIDEVYEEFGTPSPTTENTKDINQGMKGSTELPRSSIPTHLPPKPPPPPTPTPAIPPPLPTRGPNIPVPGATKAPSLPVKKKCLKLETTLFAEDYENLFYGIWSCIGGTADELSFDQGDLIHVLNRELGVKNWWVGEKGGNIGLVPKMYLSPAYEEVA